MGDTALPAPGNAGKHGASLAQRAGQAERFLKSLANRQRLMILCLLQGQERCVSDLNRRLALSQSALSQSALSQSALSQSALSQHLALLRRIGVVETRREAQTVYYRLRDERVLALLAALCELGGQGMQREAETR